jgi:hypothetical protein
MQPGICARRPDIGIELQVDIWIEFRRIREGAIICQNQAARLELNVTLPIDNATSADFDHTLKNEFKAVDRWVVSIEYPFHDFRTSAVW